MVEEPVNMVTHGIGFLISVIGSAALIGKSVAHGDLWRIVGCTTFATTLMSVYAASTLSHSFENPALRRFFRMLDQGCIYLVIAGTYTPFGLAYLRTGGWMVLLVLMWIIALCGFCSKMMFRHRLDGVAVWIYVFMGWLPVAAIYPLVGILPIPAFAWMGIGGVCYTLGTIFLMNDHRSPYLHAVWHLLVIAGSICHFTAIYGYVAA